MGALLSTRNKDSHLTTDIVVDFENAQPAESEKELHEHLAPILARSTAILEALRGYTGCGPAIAKAISKPGKEAEDEAWEAVVPHVETLRDFYTFSQELEEALPKLLYTMCSGGEVMKNLEEKQATVKQFADLLYFVLVFDDLKMSNSSIQNDFSYYRRTLSRLKMSDNMAAIDALSVKDELANKMSLFYANATPMLNAVVAAATNFLGANSSISEGSLAECLATIAAVCHNVVNASDRFKPETIAFTLRVLVGVIILYDHVHHQGAFHKNSAINVKSAIKTIKESGSTNTDGLLNALRYTTKHLNDEDTPKSIKQLLA